MTKTASTSIKDKLDSFSKKYYLNEMLRGLIIGFSLVLAYFLIINLSEYYLYFSKGIRKLFFYSFIGISLGSFFWWIARPLFKLFRISKGLSYKESAKIIGKHFGEVKDKLLNLLELEEQSEQHSQQNALLLASIEQKTTELKPVPFNAAVNFGFNKKYLRFLLPPLLVFLVILFAAPNILKEGSERIIFNDQAFEKEMPFEINILNENLNTVQGQNLNLKIEVKGQSLPDKVFIYKNNSKQSLVKTDKNHFEFEFLNLQQNEIFYMEAAGFRTKDYEIVVEPKAVISGFLVKLQYPAYLHKSNESIQNSGDLNVPEGTLVNWVFTTKNAGEIVLSLGEKQDSCKKTSQDNFEISKQVRATINYQIQIFNPKGELSDSIQYRINVTKDEFPSISVEEMLDSNDKSKVFFVGEAGDDYGFSKLQFKYSLSKSDTSASATQKAINIPLNAKGNFADFNHYVDFDKLNLQAGDQMTYYFEIWDNDGVNGPKSAKSNVKTYRIPNKDEQNKITDQKNEEIKDELKSAIDESKQMAQEMKEMQEKLLQKNQPSWEDRQKMKSLLEQQKNLQNNIDEINKKLENKHRDENKFDKKDEEVLKKQEQLEKMMNEMLSPEMKELMKKMEELLEKLDKKNMLDNMEEMKMDNEQLNKELDRMLELFKRLEMEQKMNETAEKLEELAKKQEELSKSDENSSQKQEQLNKEFDEVKDKMNQLEKMNQEINNEHPLDDLKKDLENIDEQMDNAQEQLEQQNQPQGQKNQQQAAQQMKDAANKMRQMMNSQSMEKMEEDMKALRQLLDNLIQLSFTQENLMNDFSQATINTPNYLSLIQKQHEIKEESKMVEDSLYALAKRVFQIESFVTKEIGNVNKHLNNATKLLEERKVKEAGVDQQYVMTGYNNLALMLSETMEQMQQAMAQKMPGSQMCQKPNGKKGGKSISNLMQMQEQLNDQINQMGEMMKSGKKPGDKSYNEQLAKMAQQQQAIREALENAQQEMMKNGGDQNMSKELKEIANQMEKTETDLVNKRLTEEMLQRQKEIEIRLLKAEKAQREQEMKEERESKTAQDIPQNMPKVFEEYLKKRKAETERYQTVPGNLKPFYKQLSENYFKSISR